MIYSDHQNTDFDRDLSAGNLTVRNVRQARTVLMGVGSWGGGSCQQVCEGRGRHSLFTHGDFEEAKKSRFSVAMSDYHRVTLKFGKCNASGELVKNKSGGLVRKQNRD
jgi:hypothetical protein